jgi:hypothetical protein
MKTFNKIAVYIGDSLIPETLSDSSSEAIQRFFNLDGMGKYIDLGWGEARSYGYHLCHVFLTVDSTQKI